MQRPKNDSWLVDNAADVQGYNDKRLMTKYPKLSTYIRGFILNGIFPEQRKVNLHFFLKDKSKRFILNLVDTFYLPNSLYNLISLAHLNNSGIFHNNKDENLYYIKTYQVLAQAPQ